MLTTRESFIRSAILESTTDARIAFADWDYETVLSASKTLLNVSAQMRKMNPAKEPPLVKLDPMGDLPPKPNGNGGDSGHKVETPKPQPVKPTPGVASPMPTF